MTAASNQGPASGVTPHRYVHDNYYSQIEEPFGYRWATACLVKQGE
jgi:hypothetical protein